MRQVALALSVALAVVVALAVLIVPRPSPTSPTAASPSPSPTVAAATSTPSATASSAPATAARTSSSTPSPTPRGEHTNTAYGFSVTLPEPYRRSEKLSAAFSGDKPAAQEAFTARTPADEDALSRVRCETACEIWSYVAVVEIYPNEAGTGAPREWYQRTSFAAGERIDDVTIDGRPAVKVTGGATYPVQYIVRDAARVFRVAYQVYAPGVFGPPPTGATREKLEQILASFRFTR